MELSLFAYLDPNVIDIILNKLDDADYFLLLRTYPFMTRISLSHPRRVYLRRVRNARRNLKRFIKESIIPIVNKEIERTPPVHLAPGTFMSVEEREERMRVWHREEQEYQDEVVRRFTLKKRANSIKELLAANAHVTLRKDTKAFFKVASRRDAKYVIRCAKREELLRTRELATYAIENDLLRLIPYACWKGLLPAGTLTLSSFVPSCRKRASLETLRRKMTYVSQFGTPEEYEQVRQEIHEESVKRWKLTRNPNKPWLAAWQNSEIMRHIVKEYAPNQREIAKVLTSLSHNRNPDRELVRFLDSRITAPLLDLSLDAHYITGNVGILGCLPNSIPREMYPIALQRVLTLMEEYRKAEKSLTGLQISLSALQVRIRFRNKADFRVRCYRS